MTNMAMCGQGLRHLVVNPSVLTLPLRHNTWHSVWPTKLQNTQNLLYMMPCRNKHMISRELLCIASSRIALTNHAQLLNRHYMKGHSALSAHIGQRLLQSLSCRWFSNSVQCPAKHVGDKRLPFEVDSNVDTDVTVFTYDNEKFYRMMTIFGIIQFFFWVNLALFSYTSFKALDDDKAQELFDQDSWWGKILMMQAKYKYRIATLCILLGLMVLFFTGVYPQRSISQLALLRGGREVRVTTYSHFGRQRHFTSPLEHISCKESRTTTGPWVSLKIKGKWFYFMMDKRDGQFHNPTLFDHVVGLKREFSKK